MALLLWSSVSTAACIAPYSAFTSGGASICRADLPSAEFYYGAIGSGILTDRYPICGPGRLPIPSDGSYHWMTFASSGVPRSSLVSNMDGPIEYLESTTPTYGYRGLDRCTCIGQTYSETPANGTPGGIQPPLASGEPRIYPDVFDVISSQSYRADVKYGMVAIATDNASNGRLGSIYSAGGSACGCPNVNEVPVWIDPAATTGDPVGVRCVPTVAAGPNRVIKNFDPIANAGEVMNASGEINQAGTTKIVSKITLPQSVLDMASIQTYQRRIWSCAAPYRLNLTSGQCEFHEEQNACDAGNVPNGIMPSEVSPYVTGHDKVEAFNNAVNKKLSACLNEFGNVQSSLKFDCIENLHDTYDSFNDLWSSADALIDGGQPNSIELTNASGTILTGFYQLDGRKCDTYSEFAGDIQPGIISKSSNVLTFTPRGAALPHPPNALPGYSFLVQKTLENDLSVPATPEEKKRCPILVRAAMIAACPNNPPLPLAQRTYEVRNGSGVVTQRRCSAAESVQVHFRIEQVWEIEQQQPLKSFDTFSDKTQSGVVSISQVNAEKYGLQCPPGTTRRGDVCAY